MRNRRWISSSLYAERARRPSFFALSWKRSGRRPMGPFTKSEALALAREGLWIERKIAEGKLLRGGSGLGRLGLSGLLVGLLVLLGGLLGLLVHLGVGLGRLVGLGGGGEKSERGERGGDHADHLGTPDVFAPGLPRKAAGAYSKPRAGKIGAFLPRKAEAPTPAWGAGASLKLEASAYLAFSSAFSAFFSSLA